MSHSFLSFLTYHYYLKNHLYLHCPMYHLFRMNHYYPQNLTIRLNLKYLMYR
jgi:hypothetical protein